MHAFQYRLYVIQYTSPRYLINHNLLYRKANFTLTLAIEEQTKQRNALQSKIDEIQT